MNEKAAVTQCCQTKQNEIDERKYSRGNTELLRFSRPRQYLKIQFKLIIGFTLNVICNGTYIYIFGRGRSLHPPYQIFVFFLVLNWLPSTILQCYLQYCFSNSSKQN